ncbi:MAG TPA: response regulator [Caulobacteraceae bacterium]|jgi:DNA-binding response OmpR family regulator|nr:response regulator [Caulobacteraceae bacterium]
METARRPLVLIVEDEWLIADQIEQAMSAAGYDVLGPVGRVRAALALLAASHVDAALLDINVHGERSFAVAEKLVEAATPFIFLSGYSNVELPEAFSRRPLMQKPVDVTRLCLCLQSLLSV